MSTIKITHENINKDLVCELDEKNKLYKTTFTMKIEHKETNNILYNLFPLPDVLHNIVCEYINDIIDFEYTASIMSDTIGVHIEPKKNYSINFINFKFFVYFIHNCTLTHYFIDSFNVTVDNTSIIEKKCYCDKKNGYCKHTFISIDNNVFINEFVKTYCDHLYSDNNWKYAHSCVFYNNMFITYDMNYEKDIMTPYLKRHIKNIEIMKYSCEILMYLVNFINS